ncbi:MAG: exodeoxyribonuclease VII small subunit [Oscillospiraceae bacterium]
MKETFESAGEKLNKILLALESDDITLNNALKLYAQAAELIAFSNDTINAAKLQINEIDSKLSELEVNYGI